MPGRDLIAAACDTAELEYSFDIFPWRRSQELMREGEAVLYYAALRQSFPDPVVAERFFAGLRENFANGQGKEIIEGYRLEPAPQKQ